MIIIYGMLILVPSAYCELFKAINKYITYARGKGKLHAYGIRL